MKTKTFRDSVDLSDYPHSVVICRGMRVRAFAGLKALMGLRPHIMHALNGMTERELY